MSGPIARGAKPEEVDLAVECCGAAFGGKDAQRAARMSDFFARIHKEDPYFRPENTRVALFNHRIVSVVQVFEREMLIGGSAVKMGGIGSVGTHPLHRGRGYGTLALRDALQYMERERYDLSLLFTGIHDYYGRLGWQRFEHAQALTAPVPDGLAAPAVEIENGPVRWPEELPQLMRLYDGFNRGATGPIVRSEAYWRKHTSWRPFEEGQFTAAREGGRVKAYLRCSGGVIAEVAYEPGYRGAALRLAAESLQGCGRARVMPGAHSLRRGLEGLGFVFQKEPMRWFMFRIVNLRGLLSKLTEAMSERLRSGPAAGWRGSVRLCGALERDLEPAELVVSEGGAVSVRAPGVEEPSIRLDLTHGEAIDLILGQCRGERALPGGETDRLVVNALFPKRRYIWYPRDNF